MSCSNGSHIYGPGTEVWGLWWLTASHSRHWYNSPNDTSLSSVFFWETYLNSLFMKDPGIGRIIEFEVQRSKYYSYSCTQWNFRCRSWYSGQYNFLILEQIDILKKSRVFCVVCLFSPFEICHTKEVRVSCLWAHKSHIWDLRSQQSSWWWHYTSRKLPSTIQRSPGDPGWV